MINKRNNILYVEDSQIVREAFIAFFENFHNIYEAKNGLEGLKLFDEIKDIELIITDLSMPEMNGLEMIKKIREVNQDIKIYALTAFFDDKKYINECENQNVTRIISKPMNVNKMMGFIKEDL